MTASGSPLPSVSTITCVSEAVCLTHHIRKGAEQIITQPCLSTDHNVLAILFDLGDRFCTGHIVGSMCEAQMDEWEAQARQREEGADQQDEEEAPQPAETRLMPHQPKVAPPKKNIHKARPTSPTVPPQSWTSKSRMPAIQWNPGTGAEDLAICDQRRSCQSSLDPLLHWRTTASIVHLLKYTSSEWLCLEFIGRFVLHNERMTASRVHDVCCTTGG